MLLLLLPSPAADSTSHEVASAQESQPEEQVVAGPTSRSLTAPTTSDLSMGALPVSDLPDPIPGPSTSSTVAAVASTENPSGQVSSDMLRQLVHFADAGIEDLSSFLGLVSPSASG